MIDLPTSLRLNNIVKSKAGVYLVVKEIMASGITYDRLDGRAVVGHAEWEEMEAITLTPEWLGKLGFECPEFNIWNKGGFILYIWQLEYVFAIAGHQIVNYRPILHVHQLQNLYQSLCGEELKIIL